MSQLHDASRNENRFTQEDYLNAKSKGKDLQELGSYTVVTKKEEEERGHGDD